MRRSRFAKLADDMDRGQSLSMGDVLAFDLLPSATPLTGRIATERAERLALVARPLFAAHCLGLLVLLSHRLAGGAGPWMPIALAASAAMAVSAGILLHRAASLAARAHEAVRLWGAFILAIGLSWAIALTGPAFAGGAASLDPAFVHVALAGAFCLTAAALFPIPSLTLVHGLVASLVLGLVAPDLPSAALILPFLACLALASVMNSRGALKLAAHRLKLESRAMQAARLVAEFERARRGWFWETDPEGALTYVSSQIAEELGSRPADLEGLPFADFMAAVASETNDGHERSVSFYLSTRLAFDDLTVRAGTDKELWWSISGTPNYDEYGRFLGFSGIGTDLTEQRRSEAEISKLARFDALTGLPNRTLMRVTLEDALQSLDKQHGGVALFLIDLDRFKNVNDTLGHPVGDALLKEVAGRLRAAIGDEGQVGRLGGDEFQAVFPALGNVVKLGKLAARLIENVSMPYLIEGNSISIGASVGIAVASASTDCADALIRDADLALYAAKGEGRGRWRIFTPDMHSEAKEKQALEEELRSALEEGQLRLVFQPIVNAVTEEVVGFEALSRWLHPTRGYVPTELFIALAEECGLILNIGDWVLRSACEQAATWPEGIRVAVNISPIQFAHPELVTTVMGALARSGLNPAQLELEVTESVFLSGGKATEAMFGKLKSAGVRLALDDFGTGYSSLGYLKKAPFDKIKIDQSFVRGAAKDDPTNRAILQSIIGLAENLKMDTTAEGVETHDDLALIRELGCSQVQGYIFGRPLDADAARELARSSGAISPQGYEISRPPRHSLLRFAKLQWNGMTFPVRLRNISAGGALLESDRGLPPGAIVQLDLPSCGSFGGEVRWTQESRLGIRFDRPFDLTQLSSLHGQGRWKAARPNYLDSELDPDSPWAGRTDRLTARDVRRG